VGVTAGDECLLDRSPAGDELLVRSKQAREVGARDATRRLSPAVLPRAWSVGPRIRPSRGSAVGGRTARLEAAARCVAPARSAPVAWLWAERRSRPIESAILASLEAAIEAPSWWAAFEPPWPVTLRRRPLEPPGPVGAAVRGSSTARLPRSILAGARPVVALPRPRTATRCASPSSIPVAVAEVAFGTVAAGTVSTAKSKPLAAFPVGWPAARSAPAGRIAPRARSSPA
jgi:hypothetical protein